ncbi:MAG: hypothetical protein IKV94_05615 [Clostridia bacterium]|nr:hypothetical protein [Clostridia bacterium]
MKESFSSLYTKLCSEFEKELEEKRSKRNKIAIICFSILAVIICAILITFNIYSVMLSISLIPIFYIIFRLFVNDRERKYSLYFKDNVIKALVQNVFDKAEYYPHLGIQPIQYNSSVYKERYNEYNALDKIVVTNNNRLEFSEVYTKKIIEDENGHKESRTVFSGVARNLQTECCF